MRIFGTAYLFLFFKKIRFRMSISNLHSSVLSSFEKGDPKVGQSVPYMFKKFCSVVISQAPSIGQFWIPFCNIGWISINVVLPLLEIGVGKYWNVCEGRIQDWEFLLSTSPNIEIFLTGNFLLFYKYLKYFLCVYSEICLLYQVRIAAVLKPIG